MIKYLFFAVRKLPTTPHLYKSTSLKRERKFASSWSWFGISRLSLHELLGLNSKASDINIREGVSNILNIALSDNYDKKSLQTGACNVHRIFPKF